MSAKFYFDRAINENWSICTYGLGVYGRAFIDTTLKYMNIKADYYCDKDIEKIHNYEGEGIGISVEQLKALDKDVLVLLFLSERHMQSLYLELGSFKHLHFLTWKDIHEVLDEKNVIYDYFGLNEIKEYSGSKFREVISEQSNEIKEKDKLNFRIAIYTCITNNYDNYNEPKVFEEGCDYYFITDKQGEDIKISPKVKLISIENVCPSDIKVPKDQNRYCKTHGYLIFPQYDYTIYIDGGIEIISPIKELIQKVGDIGLAFHRHPFCNDAYLEAFSLSARGRIKYSEALETVNNFVEDGFPRHYGMAEAGVIICRNNSDIARKVLQEWFELYMISSAKRDQIYLAYTLWKMEIPMDKVCRLSGNIRTNGYFIVRGSHAGY